MTARRRLRVCVHGVVHGVGFRPFVYTTAAALGLSGSVRNDTSGAIVEVEGDPAEIEQFLARLRDRPPPLAVIESIETHDVPPVGGTGFAIADTSRSGTIVASHISKAHTAEATSAKAGPILAATATVTKPLGTPARVQ